MRCWSGHLVGIHVARADDLHRGSVLMMRKKYRQINMTHVHLWCGLKRQKLLILMAFSHGFMACHFPWPWNQMSSRTGCLALCTQFLGLQTYFPCRFPLTRSKLKNPNWKCKAWDVPKKVQPLSGPTTTFRFLKTWKQLPSHIPRSITGIAILVLNPS